MTDTKTLTDDIIVAASECGARLFRNNVGVATYNHGGKISKVRYGVGPVGGGGGDLIGFDRDGRFLSIEVKVGSDKQSDAQKKWERWVNMGGGRAGVARSVEDAISIINMIR